MQVYKPFFNKNGVLFDFHGSRVVASYSIDSDTIVHLDVTDLVEEDETYYNIDGHDLINMQQDREIADKYDSLDITSHISLN